MTVYGLLTTGFVPKPLDVIRDELATEFKSAFGASFDTTAETSTGGRLIDILAEQYNDLWLMSEQIYNAQNPDKATGDALDAVCAITGTTREPARASVVEIACVGDVGTELNAGQVVSVTEVNGSRFVSIESGTFIAIDVWLAATVYSEGARVENGGNIYECTVAGTSAGSGGPSGTGSAIVDNTVTWMFLGEGDGAIDITFESEELGPIIAASGSLTTIETPVSGWNNAINVFDADLGALVESDASLRTRRELELAIGGNASVDSIRASVLAVADVVQAIVFENNTDLTDADGVPPHAIEVVVQGGDDTAIAEAIFASVAAGIYTHGSTDVVVTDTAENEHTIRFSRPVEIDIYVDITITRFVATYPADGDAQVKQALVDLGDTFAIGKNVVSSRLASAAFAVAGVDDTRPCKIKTSPTPTVETTIAIGARERAMFDTSRITVTLAVADP